MLKRKSRYLSQENMKKVTAYAYQEEKYLHGVHSKIKEEKRNFEKYLELKYLKSIEKCCLC